MATKKRGLGRQLEELLTGSQRSVELDTLTSQPLAASLDSIQNLQKVAIEQIQPGRYQPRKTFNSETLQSLADSIKAQGVIQPVVLRQIDEGGYELIAGERRWRAAKLAGLEFLPAIIQTISDEAALAISLIENIQREDLNPIEKAQALQQLAEGFHLTHHEIAEKVGQSRTSVTNTLRLLRLPADIRAYMEKGQLEAGHGRAMLSLDHEAQCVIVKRILTEDLSVRQTEQLVQAWPWKKTASPALENRSNLDQEMVAMQAMLCDRLETKVQFRQNQKGQGKVIIHYKNRRELKTILEHIE